MARQDDDKLRPTVVEGDPKVPFSIVTTPGCRIRVRVEKDEEKDLMGVAYPKKKEPIYHSLFNLYI